jgi:hypothetical protein
MKKLLLICFVFLSLLSCVSAEKAVVTAPEKMIKYGNPVTVYNYTLHEYGNWQAKSEDAENYGVNLYFTRNGADYYDSNSVIYFYYVADDSQPLSTVILTDKNNFYEKYPGIQITEYDLGKLDFSRIDTKTVKGNFENKEYFAVLYNFTNVMGQHEDQYQLVVFFKFRTDSPHFCVLEIASTDDEVFKYIDDFKKIFMTVSENPAEGGDYI